ALDVGVVDLLQLIDGPPLLVAERLALLDVEEVRRDEPALAVADLAGLLHGVAGVVEPVVGDLEEELGGLLAVGGGRRQLEQLAVGVGGGGVAALEAQTFRLVKGGFEDDRLGLVRLVGDVVEQVAGLAVFAAAEQFAGAGEPGLGRVGFGRLLLGQRVA